eukprot:TRINITY_DN269_c3_g1_i1.p1 TRINITY_DN269_c3_g1~~TRINITY_DN269_c3_g1_i1.p1  ORF type:complete len:322 (-),score=109.02 TRINITY_DN269_c3_g1_i1:9-974(-)
MSETRAKSVRWSSVEENVKEYTDSEGEEVEWKKAPGQSEVEEEDEPIDFRFGSKSPPVRVVSDDGNDYQALWKEATNEAQSLSDRIEGLCEIIDSSESEIAQLQQRVLELEEQLANSGSQSIPQTGDSSQSDQKIQLLEAKVAALSLKAKNRKTRARKFKAKYNKERENMKKYRREARSLRPLAKGGEAERYKEAKQKEKEEKKKVETSKNGSTVSTANPSAVKAATVTAAAQNNVTVKSSTVGSAPVKSTTPASTGTATKSGGSFVASFNKPSGTGAPVVKAAAKAPTTTSTDKLRCAICQHTAAVGKYCKRCGGLMREI